MWDERCLDSDNEGPLLPPEEIELTRGERIRWCCHMGWILFAWALMVAFGAFCWWVSLGYMPHTTATFWKTHPTAYLATWLSTFFLGAWGCSTVGLAMFVLNIKHMGRPYRRMPQCRCDTPSHSEEEWV
jgi:hypothetical protein